MQILYCFLPQAVAQAVAQAVQQGGPTTATAVAQGFVQVRRLSSVHCIDIVLLLLLLLLLLLFYYILYFHVTYNCAGLCQGGAPS